MTDREVTSRLQAYVNIEAIGSAGAPLLFETGPGNGWLVKQWARHAPNPRGASFGIEIYRRLPNDTDFSVLKRLGIPGLNFGATEDSYAYHTTRDTPERLASRTIRETGEQVVAVMTALDAIDVTQRSESSRRSSTSASVSPRPMARAPRSCFALAALVLGIVAWVRVTGAAIRLRGIAQWLLAIVWTLLGSAAVVASMIGATWALRHAREVYHPWYARPGRMFLLQLAIGFTVGWGVARIGQWLPQKLHGLRHPLMAWSITLPIWIALAATMFSLAPGAAYLWVLPLLAAGVFLAFLPLHSTAVVRLASGVVLVAAAALWLQPTTSLLHFIVATLGRLPIVSPSFVYAAVLTGAALMIVPPLIATVTPTRPLLRPTIGTAAGLFAIAMYFSDEPVEEGHVNQLLPTLASKRSVLAANRILPTDGTTAENFADKPVGWSEDELRRWFGLRTSKDLVTIFPLDRGFPSVSVVAAVLDALAPIWSQWNAGASRNPPWQRDELILALILHASSDGAFWTTATGR